MSGKKGYRTFRSVSHRFRFVKHYSQLFRYKQQVYAAGSTVDKQKEIAKRTLAEFTNAKERKLPVNDADLRRWAMAKQREIELMNFKASKTWLWQFKNANRIVSRKITHFVTNVGNDADHDLADDAARFVASVRERMKRCSTPDTMLYIVR
jgi:hypothetical protein